MRRQQGGVGVNASSHHDDSNVSDLHTGARALDAEFDALMARFKQLDQRQLDSLYDDADKLCPTLPKPVQRSQRSRTGHAA
jgi:hypothetical protein